MDYSELVAAVPVLGVVLYILKQFSSGEWVFRRELDKETAEKEWYKARMFQSLDMTFDTLNTAEKVVKK